MPRALCIRWTIGDVSQRGFEALRLSIWGAQKIFGKAAEYVVCVNSLPLDEARDRTGDVSRNVNWLDVSQDVPAFLREHLDSAMAEGVGWKFAPLRLRPDRFELALDNDCILWSMPGAIAQWLAGDHQRRCIMAEDVRAMYGRFADQCGPEPRNGGLRGWPPGFDMERELREVLQQAASTHGSPIVLTSELDEQGLQTAAMSREAPLLAVSIDEVTISSPFYPHRPDLGRCGAHFVGLNARHIPWNYYDRSADECMAEHWHRHRPTLYRNVLTRAAERNAPCEQC